MIFSFYLSGSSVSNASAGETVQHAGSESVRLHGRGALLQVRIAPPLVVKALLLLLGLQGSILWSLFVLPLLRPAMIRSELRSALRRYATEEEPGGGASVAPVGQLQSLIAQRMQRAQELLEEMRLQVWLLLHCVQPSGSEVAPGWSNQ